MASECHPPSEFVSEYQCEGTDEATWYALTYAIWRDRVLENGDLAPLDSTTVIERLRERLTCVNGGR